jgi:hypothetical protein
MNTQLHTEDFYKTIRENRMLMYSKPKRYFNRDEEQGSTFRFLFLIETIVFIVLMTVTTSSMAQTARQNAIVSAAENQAAVNIYNYNTIYNSGKVFLSWTSKNEQEDCVYVIERSPDGQVFQSVGVKEGIGSEIELYYSWIDQTPPAGFAYYRVKKITKEGSQLYSAVNAVINQASNFENYAQGEPEK